MFEELDALEDAIRRIWKVVGKSAIESEVARTPPFHREEFTLLLLTDAELEQLCQSYAEKVRAVRWWREVLQDDDRQVYWEGIWAELRLARFAEVWNEERVHSIVDKVFEGYDPEKERAEFEARLKEEARDRQKREGPPLEEPPWGEPEPMFDGLPF